jgi:hypothetical protein
VKILEGGYTFIPPHRTPLCASIELLLFITLQRYLPDCMQPIVVSIEGVRDGSAEHVPDVGQGPDGGSLDDAPVVDSPQSVGD